MTNGDLTSKTVETNSDSKNVQNTNDTSKSKKNSVDSSAVDNNKTKPFDKSNYESAVQQLIKKNLITKRPE